MAVRRRSHYFGFLKMFAAEQVSDEHTGVSSAVGAGDSAGQKQQQQGSAAAAAAAAKAKAKMRSRLLPKAELNSVPRPSDDFFRSGGI